MSARVIPPGSGAFRPTVLAFAAAGMVAFAELYGVQALLPAIASEFQVSAASAALAQSAGALGVALAVVPWSLAARRMTRGTLIRVAVIATILLSPLVVAASSLEGLLVVRFLQGAVLAGIPALAVTHLGDHLDRARAVAAAGWYISGTAVGGLSGRLVAGLVGAVAEWRLALVAVSLVAAAAAVVFLFLLPRVGKAPVDSGGARRAIGGRDARLLWALAFVQMGCFAALYNFIGFRLIAEPFRFPEVVVTAVFALYIVGSVAAARSGRIALRIGRRRALRIGVAVQAAGVVLTIPDQSPVILVGVAVVTAGFFTVHALAAGWVAELAGGSAVPSAVYTIAYYAGAAVLGWCFGLALDAGGWTALSVSLLGACVVSALLAGVLRPDSATRGAGGA